MKTTIPTPQEFWQEFVEMLPEMRRKFGSREPDPAEWREVVLEGVAEVLNGFENLDARVYRGGKWGWCVGAFDTREREVVYCEYEHQSDGSHPKGRQIEIGKLHSSGVSLRIFIGYFNSHPEQCLRTELAGLDAGRKALPDGTWLFICAPFNDSSFAPPIRRTSSDSERAQALMEHFKFRSPWMAFILQGGQLSRLEKEW